MEASVQNGTDPRAKTGGQVSSPQPTQQGGSQESNEQYGGSAVHQATMRVNSLTLSETPGLRKRNREDEDYSFRVDKMAEAPASVPRTQATLTPEEYMQQQAQHHGQQQGFLPKDDSFSVMLPFLLPHSNSNGSTGSGSLMGLLGAQDSLNQDQLKNAQGGSDQASLPAFIGAGNFQPAFALGNGMGGFSFVPTTVMQTPSLNFASQNSGIGIQSQTSGLGMQAQNSGIGLQAQNSGLSLPSQTSGLMAPTTSGLSLGPSSSGTTSGLSLGPTTSGLSMSGQGAGMPMGNPGMMGINPMGMGIPLAGFQSAYPAPTFMNFSTAVGRGPGFDYLGDVRPRYDQAGAPAQQYFSYSFASPAATADGYASSRKSPPGSNGSKPKRGSASASRAKAAQASAMAAAGAAGSSGEKYVSWSAEQEAALMDAVQELGTDDWEAIAARIPGPPRSSAQCLRHWENKLSPSIKRGQWSAEEDEALRRLVERASHQGLGLLDIPWADIKECIPGRTLKQVRERWRSNLDPNIVRGDWTPYEDEMIIKMRDEQGMGWASIARALKGRTEHSVKTRHRSMQRAKRRAWSDKEDRTILEMAQSGASFVAIAQELKNRTAASVEIRWNELNGRV